MTLFKQILSGIDTQTRAGIVDNRGVRELSGTLASGTIIAGGFVKRTSDLNGDQARFIPATSTDNLIYYVRSMGLHDVNFDSADLNKNYLQLVEIIAVTEGISQVNGTVTMGMYLMIENATGKLIPWTTGNIKIAIALHGGIAGDFVKMNYIVPQS